MYSYVQNKVTCKWALGRSLGGIPEEGIVIIRGDISMGLTAPENLPVGQDVGVKDSDTDDPDFL